MVKCVKYSQRFSARNTKVYKIRKLCMTVFYTFYDILQPNFTILLNLACSFNFPNSKVCLIGKWSIGLITKNVWFSSILQ